MEIEQEEKLQKLERASEVAAFNLRTAFAEKETNLLSTKDSQAKAYIFKNRPLRKFLK